MNDIPLAVPMAVGLLLPAVSLVVLLFTRRQLKAHGNVRRLRLALIVLGLILGVPLSYVPWPIDHPLRDRPHPRMRFWGIPAPMAGTIKADGRSWLQPAFVVAAIPLNGIFAASVLQGVLWMARRNRLQSVPR